MVPSEQRQSPEAAMRMYAHDYVWGVQARREFSPAPGEMFLGQLIDRAVRAARRLRPARA